MSWVKIGRADHNKIRRSPDIQKALADLAEKIAADADSRAGITDGYGHGDVTVGSDRARAHVWAQTGAAIHAERKDAILMGIAGDEGAVNGN